MSINSYQKKTRPALWATLPPRGKALTELLAKQGRVESRVLAKAKERLLKAVAAAVRARKRVTERTQQPRKAHAPPRRRVGKAKSAPSRRKPVRSVSVKRAEQNRHYTKLRREFLTMFPVCEGCFALFGAKRPAPSTEVHHRIGRRGELLCRIEHFRALCSNCHRFVHNHPELARSAGLLAPLGKWGSA